MEAHFVEKNEQGEIVEGWPIGSQYNYPQHKTIDDRLNMAKKFIHQYQWPIPTVIDSIENEFNEKYAAWPDRAYLIFEWTSEIEELFN